MRWHCIPFNRCVATDTSAVIEKSPLSYVDLCDVCVQQNDPIFRSIADMKDITQRIGLLSESFELNGEEFAAVFRGDLPIDQGEGVELEDEEEEGDIAEDENVYEFEL